MDQKTLQQLVNKVLAAWTSQDVDAVLDCYTPDLIYRDPNTRGAVEGAEAMRRYLKKLFSAWQMSWSCREVLPLAAEQGVALLWHAVIRRPDGKGQVEIDGMDLVVLHGQRIARNEVYFDRANLAPLIQ